jgi:class 3 adenylate cyclase
MPIVCPRCDFHNPDGFHYCGNCGHSLGRHLDEEFPKVPPFVSSPLYHPLQKLPSGRYGQFQAAARKARGERREVAILFADLGGYTALSNQLAPEEVFSLINRYLAVLIEQVYRHEGVIDKFTGDGIMAIFGAPIAHRDDAERAVRTALQVHQALDRLSAEIRGEMGVEIQVRLGVHYGAVIFGQVGINLGDAVSVMDYTAIGDTVNLASRLEQAAEMNSTLVSRAIYKRTREFFQYEPVSPLSLKGFRDLVTAYRLIGLRRSPIRP